MKKWSHAHSPTPRALASVHTAWEVITYKFRGYKEIKFWNDKKVR